LNSPDQTTAACAGDLDLPAVANRLVEDAELVADAVADGRDLERRERIEIAGRQASEPSIPQPRLFFLLDERVQIEPELRCRAGDFRADSETHQVVLEVRTEEELRRQITDGLVPGRRDRIDRADDPLHRAIANGQGNGDVPVVGGRLGRRPALRITHVIENRLLDRLDVRGGSSGAVEEGCRGRRLGNRHVDAFRCQRGAGWHRIGIG
jgi:hypothetical protein